jgi:hypothetical protein
MGNASSNGSGPFGAFHKLHHQVIRPDVKQRADIRMVQRGDGAGFPLEPFTEARRQNLDRHIPPETRIVGFVHFAHAALADGRDDFIRTESITWLEWHLND